MRVLKVFLIVFACTTVGCATNYMEKMETRVVIPMSQLASALDKAANNLETHQNRISEGLGEQKETLDALSNAKLRVKNIKVNLKGIGQPPMELEAYCETADSLVIAIDDYLDTLTNAVATPRNLEAAQNAAREKAMLVKRKFSQFQQARQQAMARINYLGK